MIILPISQSIEFVSSVPVSGGGPRSSPSGSTIPALAQIVDGSLNIWTVLGQTIYENGVKAGTNSLVNLLLFFNNSFYYQTVITNLWFQWNGTAWTSLANGDPRINGTLFSITVGTGVNSNK